MNPLQQESMVAAFESQYAQELEIVGEALSSKYNYEMTPNDVMAFGTYAKTWESYIPYFESDITTRDSLGEVLNSNLGIIVASYSSLPMQYIGSIQPIADEAGVVYKRVATATTTRAGVTAGDELIGIHGAVNNAAGNYTGETIVDTSKKIIAATVDYTINLGVNLGHGSIKIDIAGKGKAMDDGEGHILGTTIDGSASTVNYTTGQIVLKFASIASFAADDIITVTAKGELVTPSGADIPGFKYELKSQVVQAQYWLVKSGFSSISDMIVKKKFGTDLGNEIVADAAQLINTSVLYQAISKLRLCAIANEAKQDHAITFSKAADSGISTADHRRTFDDVLVESTDAMYKLAGRGDVNFIIAGSNGIKILKTLGLQITKRGVAGPHLIGFYDTSIPVFYAPNGLVSADELIVGYRGQSWYESALIYAPFLPVTTVKGNTGTAFSQEAGVYCAAGMEIVNTGFVVRITLT